MKATVLVIALCAAATLAAQQPPAQQQPPAGGGAQGRGEGRGGGAFRGAEPLDLNERTGFESIFDGTLKGWDGDSRYWRAEGGSLVGEATEANKLDENTFIIWNGEVADFELKVEFRMSSTNSGIQVRSSRVAPGGEGRGAVTGKWVLKGYQADIDFDNRFTGMIYEERGRGFLMQPGQAVRIARDGSKRVVGNLQRNADELKALIKPGDWNHVHLVARGGTLINTVNGQVTGVLIDDDEKGRALKGLLGFQLHTGPPMKIEFRNIYLRRL